MEMADTKLKSQENMGETNCLMLLDLKHPRPIEETNNHSESKIIEISEGNGNLKAPLVKDNKVILNLFYSPHRRCPK